MESVPQLTSACPVKFFEEKERSGFNRGPPISGFWSLVSIFVLHEIILRILLFN
jgi:hypothetical protein